MSGLEFDDEMRAKIKGHTAPTKKEKADALRISQEINKRDEKRRYDQLLTHFIEPIKSILNHDEHKRAISYDAPLAIFYAPYSILFHSDESGSSFTQSDKNYAILQTSKSSAVAFDYDVKNGGHYQAIPLRRYNGTGSGPLVISDNSKIKKFNSLEGLQAYAKETLAKAIADNSAEHNKRKAITFSKLGAFALAARLLYSCASDAAELPEHNNFDTHPDTHLMIEP